MAFDELYFRRNDTGYVFFPNGTFGKGYAIREDQRAEFGKFINRSGLLLLAVAIVSILVLDFWLDYGWIAYSLILLIALLRHLRLMRMLRGVPRSSERLRFTEFHRGMARSMPLWMLILLLVLILLLLAFTLLVAYDSYIEGERAAFWLAIVPVICFTALLILIANIGWLRRSQT